MIISITFAFKERISKFDHVVLRGFFSFSFETVPPLSTRFLL